MVWPTTTDLVLVLLVLVFVYVFFVFRAVPNNTHEFLNDRSSLDERYTLNLPLGAM